MFYRPDSASATFVTQDLESYCNYVTATFNGKCPTEDQDSEGLCVYEKKYNEPVKKVYEAI